MKQIKLGNGLFSLIDDRDLISVSKFNWYTSESKKGKFYVKRLESPQIYLHRFLMDSPEGKQIDHINGNRLDNRKSNLRMVSQTQNNYNSIKRIGTTSKFKGVFYDKSGKRIKRWTTQGRILGKKTFLGRYLTQEEAAKTYDTFALKHYGEFAKTNFI